MMMSVKQQLLEILKTLPPQVTLVAVSKTKPPQLIREAYEAGQRDFGENYVQELVEKHAQLPADIRWHYIGHLQSNKVKYIAPFVHLIHGVDSLRLLKEIDKQGAKHQRQIHCLLQIHIAMEDTKFGFSYQECEELMSQDEFRQLRHVKVLGLMAMASNTDDPEHLRSEFAGLKRFYDKISQNVLEFSVLSAGMSSDYKIAMEEGSNMIRIGSTIFGGR